MVTYSNTLILNSLDGVSLNEGTLNLRGIQLDKESITYLTKAGESAEKGQFGFGVIRNSSDYYKLELLIKTQKTSNASAINPQVKKYTLESYGYTENMKAAFNAINDGTFNLKDFSFSSGGFAVALSEHSNLVEGVLYVFEEDEEYPDGGYWKKQGTVRSPKKSNPGFGTYEQIMKDIKLPTCSNTGLAVPHLDEMPIIGALYDQYIITYTKDRGVLGNTVGENTVSQTTHSIWVKKELSSQFKALLDPAEPTAIDETEE
jgi:hypothetical protein